MKASAGIAATARRGTPTPETAETTGKAVEKKPDAPARIPAVQARKAPPRAQASASAAPARRTAPDEVERVATTATPEPASHAEAKPAGFAAPPQTPAPVGPPPGTITHYQPGPDRRALPRPMAAAETFVEGDHVVYPTHGVGRVERIAVEEIAGHKLELIHITFEENRMTLRVPVAKARTAGLRKLASRDLFDKAMDVLRGRARIKRTMWSRRAQEYEAKINSGDPLAIAEVVRDLHRNAGQPDQSFSERQIYESAMDRLGAELAALDETDKATAAIKLVEFLKTV
jgi:CarD family transcriptional regulator